MKAVIQRVKNACVSVDGETVGSCGQGFLVLLGASKGDGVEEAVLLADKTVNLRVFKDENGKMNKSILDIKGEILVVSQFTLCADLKKGNRPSFIGAAPPEEAEALYELYCKKISDNGIRRVEKGIFGADMQVSLVNDGPVTILYDTQIWRKHEN